MILPEQLEIRELPKAVRGYSIPETDALINYLKEKYAELSAEFSELEKKYAEAREKVERSEKDEESIRSALINAQKASSKITSEANEKADMIVRSTKVSCDKIMFDFRQALAAERKKLADVVEAAGEFKERLLELHREQMAQIEELTSDDSYKDLLEDDDSAVNSVISGIKSELAKNAPTGEKTESVAAVEAVEEDKGYDGPVPIDFDKAYERRNAEAQDRMFEKPDQKIFEEAKLDSEYENNPNMTKTFTAV